MENNNLIPFEGKEIRKVWHDEQWYFSVVDVISILTDSTQPKRYWADIKKRSLNESGQPFAFCEQLKMKATDGRSRLTDAANTEGILRIVMSVPSPKAEPSRSSEISHTTVGPTKPDNDATAGSSALKGSRSSTRRHRAR